MLEFICSWEAVVISQSLALKSYLTVTLQLYREIGDIMEGRPLDEQPNHDDISKMEYLEWVINETMRLYPAAPRSV